MTTWYREGLVSLTAGSDLVAGVGTEWVDSVLPGGIFFTPTGLIEVERVISDGSLKLVTPYAGPSVAGAEYAIAPTQGYVVDLARQVNAVLGTFGELKDAWQEGTLVGKGVALKGVKDAIADLPLTGNVPGDAWMVDGHLHVWTGTTWLDQGATVSTPELEALRDAAGTSAGLAIGAAMAVDTTRKDYEDRVYPGVYGVAPSAKPHSGLPSAEGDRCTVLVAGVPYEHLRLGGGWLIPNIDAAQLGLSGGSAMIGTPEGTAQAALERRALSVFSTVQLRALSGARHGSRVAMHQYQNNALLGRPMGGGDLYVDRNDTTTPDDGAITFVLADGARAKRRINGRVWVSWFGSYGDGVRSDSAAIQAAVNYVGDKLELLTDPEDRHLLTTPIVAAARLNLRSESVKGLVGTTVFDGAGLPDGEFCLYFNRPYSQIKGIKFIGKGRLVSGLSLGRPSTDPLNPYAAHGTVIESCEFELCRRAIASQYACHVRVESSKFESCYKAIELDKTSNTWKISKTVAFNFLGATSHSFLHVIDADQITLENIWSEQSSAPVVVAERFTNLGLFHPWIEHLVSGNTSPLFVVAGAAGLHSYNFVVHDADVISNHPVLATLSNLQNFELRNVRQAGLRIPNALPQINCTNVDLVKMESVYVEYSDSPPTQVNRIVVNGANRVTPEDDDILLSPKVYENRVFDSSFKTLANTASSGDVTRVLDTTIGVHDSNSMKLEFGAAGTGRGRTANPINLVANQQVRLSAYLWTDAEDLFNKVILRIAGVTSGKNRQVSLTRTPRRFDLTWQVPATGFDGAYYAFFDYSVSGALRAYNVWVDDVQIVVDSDPIPFLPYVMNNSLTAPMRIGAGLNLTEHTLMGRKVTHGLAAPLTGSWRVGDFCWNDAPAPGGYMGWVCTMTGTPGTWKTFGGISN